MSKVWLEHEYSVQKLSSSVDFQIMLMSCVQKKVLSTEGIYHWNRANEKARWSPTKRVCMGAWTDTLGKKEGHQPLSHKGIVIIFVNAKMTDCLHLVIFTLPTWGEWKRSTYPTCHRCKLSTNYLTQFKSWHVSAISVLPTHPPRWVNIFFWGSYNITIASRFRQCPFPAPHLTCAENSLGSFFEN